MGATCRPWRSEDDYIYGTEGIEEFAVAQALGRTKEDAQANADLIVASVNELSYLRAKLHDINSLARITREECDATKASLRNVQDLLAAVTAKRNNRREPWSDECRAAIDEVESKYDIETASIEYVEEILEKLDAETQRADEAVERERRAVAANAALREQVEGLQRWKADALAVESEWDVQAVGNALGLQYGVSIHKHILPGILALKADNERLRTALAKLVEWDVNHPQTENYKTEIDYVIDGARAALKETDHAE